MFTRLLSIIRPTKVYEVRTVNIALAIARAERRKGV